MHLKNEKETNPSTNLTSLSSTTSSSTTSTDSGVVIIDSTATFNRQHRDANESEVDKECTTKDKQQTIKTTTKTTTTAATAKDITQQEQQQLNDKSAISRSINIENTLNISSNATRPPHPLPPQVQTERGAIASKNYSPTVSIRSTTISIISIDENAIDSSVIDTDSDIEADAEGEHSNYTVKKLGQQITYPPNSNEIPNLNQGLKVISQQIRPNASPHPNGGSPTLADHILNGSLCTPTSGTLAGSQQSSAPQIGSIALTNSTDVTFGDKHFYEGPVTIQQFLIDSRDKGGTPNGDSGHDNSTFNGETPTQNGGKMFPASNEARLRLPHTLSRRAIWITSIFVVLTIIIGSVIATQTDIFSTAVKPQKFDNIGSGRILRIVPREAWLAQPPLAEVKPMTKQVQYVIAIPTQTDNCSSQAECVFRVRFIQSFDIESLGKNDIAYNFLIGGDGNVYEGRGWNKVGAHIKGLNDGTISFAYIGTFYRQPPSPKQLNVTQLLLNEGVSRGKLPQKFKFIGANQLEPDSFKAPLLYASFTNFPQWSNSTH